VRTGPPLLKSRGFSLVELLVVMAIIAIIARFTVPAVSTMLRGARLTQASEMLTDQLSLARQLALSENRPVEVRFFRYGDPEVPGENVNVSSTGQFRALQIYEILDNGVVMPLDKVQMLPTSVIMNSTSGTTTVALSSLFLDQTMVTSAQVLTDSTAPNLPRGVNKNYDYFVFRFLQDGSTSLSPSTSQVSGGIWYVTIHDINDLPKIKGSALPPNYFTLQIDPLNGLLKSFRPMTN
jgi:uncharacterized protein (TIGR02596 family)